jgi:small subunit ribosomal protein S16
MVKIRLRRMGAKKQPTYRFVVSDSRSPRDGRFIEILGHYNPRTEPKTLEVNEAKAKEWLAKGAQPSDTVRRLFAEKGIMERGPVPATKRAPKNKGAA